MIVCPNCNHQNPDGAVQCEACYTPLPAMTACPNCGTTVQADASFCGQCGFNLQAATPSEPGAIGSSSTESLSSAPTMSPDFGIPDLPLPDPLIEPEALSASTQFPGSPLPEMETSTEPEPVPPPPTVAEVSAPPMQAPPMQSEYHTQLQTQIARLLHLQTNSTIELPQTLSVIHIGKPNDRIPPDIDVSGFPNSEIVSRIHADIRLEGDAYYIEDVGSSNGTYINNLPLPMGNRHRLRPGDRISLGKGDKVTFLFQLT